MIVSNTLHQLPDPKAFLTNVKDLIFPAGILDIIDIYHWMDLPKVSVFIIVARSSTTSCDPWPHQRIINHRDVGIIKCPIYMVIIVYVTMQRQKLEHC